MKKKQHGQVGYSQVRSQNATDDVTLKVPEDVIKSREKDEPALAPYQKCDLTKFI